MQKTVIQGIPMSHIAMALSAFLLLCALSAIYNPRKFRAAVEEFLNSGNTMMRASGLVCFFVAFFILNTHWTIKLSSTRSIMTAIGYLMVICGVARFWFPEFVRKTMKDMVQKDVTIYIFAIVGLFVALGIGYLGLRVY